jgi:hypothetical protein
MIGVILVLLGLLVLATVGGVVLAIMDISAENY